MLTLVGILNKVVLLLLLNYSPNHILSTQVSEYNRIVVIESTNEDMERMVKERAETLKREDDKEEISRAKIMVYNETTGPMIDSLGDADKAVKVKICVLYND